MDSLVFRAPLHFRVLTVVGALVTAGGAFFVTTGARHFGPVNIGAFFVFTSFVGTVGYRQVRLSVTAQGDELEVRNYLTTRRIPRDHIRGFERGRPSTGRGETILVNTGMSSVPLDALFVWPQTQLATRRRENALELLSDWAQPG